MPEEDPALGAGTPAPESTAKRGASEPKSEAENQAAHDARVLLSRLAGKPAAEVLGKLSSGDPLKAYSLCVKRTRERYFVIDPDRLFERALAVIAVGVEQEPESVHDPDWLLGRVDRAIDLVLNRDAEDEAAGQVAESPEEHFHLFVDGFFIEPPLARGASVRLNGLEERIRKGFQLLMIEGRTVEECVQNGLGPYERLREDMLAVLEAVGLLGEERLDERPKKQGEET